MGWMEGKERDGMDLVLPFWNFIVGERTGVATETLEIPHGKLQLGIVYMSVFC